MISRERQWVGAQWESQRRGTELETKKEEKVLLVRERKGKMLDSREKGEIRPRELRLMELRCLCSER